MKELLELDLAYHHRFRRNNTGSLLGFIVCFDAEQGSEANTPRSINEDSKQESNSQLLAPY